MQQDQSKRRKTADRQKESGSERERGMGAEGGWSLGGVELSLAIKVLLAEYKEPSGRGTTPGGRQLGVSLE